jgi:lipid-A-disaccharide synthase
MNIFISVGEVSGDIHGANLINRFNSLYPGSEFSGLGGDKMKEAGQKQLYTVKEMAILGIVEVIRHLPFLRKVFKEIEKLFAEGKIDILILVDYPGFNLRLAKMAKKHGIPVFYYICPQMWAWGRKRIFKIKKYVDHSFVIFDFEEKFFARYGVPATFIGHPIVEAVRNLEPRGEGLKKEGEKVLLLLPGSRKHEVQTLLPAMLEAANALIKDNPQWKYFIARASHLNRELYQAAEPEKLIDGRYYDLLSVADAAVVASGTATLETAIFRVPHIIAYRVNSLTWYLGKMLVKLPFIGMANILAGREIVPELLQNDLTPERLRDKLAPLLKDDSPERQAQLSVLGEITRRLGGEKASETAVKKIMEIYE